jgi:23S rRNA (cytosine1962-C5)-methyltransferase
VDWYAGRVVVAEYVRQQTGPDWLPRMARAVGEALGVPAGSVFLRQRHTGVDEGPRYGRMEARGERFQVRERDFRFWVNLSDYLDTGLFSDHRDTRVLVRGLSAGADFLNLYCYTGTFTCAAAAGGAASSVSVDRAATVLDWTADNLELNGLGGPQHRRVKADVVDFLDDARAAGRRWTLAFVDPPSFSNTTGATGGFDVQRDHPDLLRRVLDVMAPGGEVFFSTNHQRFEPRLDGLGAAAIAEITPGTIPEDFRNRKVHRCWRIRI